MVEPNAMLFSIDELVKLTGLSKQRLRYWTDAERGLYVPAHPGEDGRPPLFSFRDVVSLRTLAALRERVSLQSLRKLGDYLHQRYEQPWSRIRFYVAGREIQFDTPDKGVRVSGSKPGQQVSRATLFDVVAVESAMAAAARKLRERRPEQRGKVERRRKVLQSRPVIAGTRIPTETVFHFHEAGYDVPAIIAEFPQLTERDVRAAFAFERKRRKAS